MQQQQNMNTQNQQILYQQPPAVISTKDSLYLTDMLSWNLLAMKKAHFYAQHCQNAELKDRIRSLRSNASTSLRKNFEPS